MPVAALIASKSIVTSARGGNPAAVISLSNVKLDNRDGCLHTESRMTAAPRTRTTTPVLGLALVLVLTVIVILPL
jgi:hypothetical protein